MIDSIRITVMVLVGIPLVVLLWSLAFFVLDETFFKGKLSKRISNKLPNWIEH
jgi:hypothetical protein